ncbi:MAG: 4Fe-4S dicluster domain-containing protein [Acidobacteriia bacterium]|nr:4Fe-4S dicluster domain-containing protein [Terriglobia bacterium]
MAAQAPAQSETRETAHLDCIHCGICLSACPTYLQLGGEADSPRGRIYLINAMQEGRIGAAGPRFQQHMLLCLECRACETACPSGVRFSAMMNEARAQIGKSRRLSAGAAFVRYLVLRKIFLSRRLMHFSFRMLRFYQRSGIRRLLRASRILRLFPGHLIQMEALLPEIPKSPRYPWSEGIVRTGRKRVLLFEGCIMPELFGPVHEATVRVLQHHGFSVALPARQACCGAVHLHEGDPETARQLARKNIAAFEKEEAAAIIVNAAGCGAMLKEYDELLAADPAYAGRARAFSRRVRDISEFLDAIGINRNMERLDLKVTYDDPCHLLHAQGIKAAPRNLLRSIPGLELVELRDADRCCGSAGIYNITHPEMSSRILDEKIANIIRSGAQVVASGNPGCLLQIQAGLRAKNLPTRVAHPIELIDQAYRPRTTKFTKPAKT